MARAMRLLTQMNYFPDSDEERENGNIAGGYLVARTKKKKKKKKTGSRKEEPEDLVDDDEDKRDEGKDTDDTDGERTDEDAPKIDRPLVGTPPESAKSPLQLRRAKKQQEGGGGGGGGGASERTAYRLCWPLEQKNIVCTPPILVRMRSGRASIAHSTSIEQPLFESTRLT